MANRIVMIDKGNVALDADLDELKENYCVVNVPYTEENAERLKKLPSCLRTRRHGELLTGVFNSAPEDLLRELSEFPDANATRVSLEDLFIEYVGGQA